LNNLINDTTTVGGTDLNDGLNGAIDLLLDADATSSLKVIVFLTDGQGNYIFAAGEGPASLLVRLLRRATESMQSAWKQRLMQIM
jgi:Mg-chelatase subunit ChlD